MAGIIYYPFIGMIVMAGENYQSANVTVDSEGRQYHLRVAPGDIARYVLLPGDPARTDLISSIWDERRLIASHREFKAYTGRHLGAPISVVSTGIGSPSALIAVEELFRVGADTFIRVGTMGALSSRVKPGDLVIGVAAVRLEGASKDYVIPEYPAYANYEVVAALIEAAERRGFNYHLGVVASTDTFYLGQGRPGFRGYMTSRAARIVPDLQAAGVLGFEMESSAIMTVASLYGGRAGCVCAAIANRVTNDFVPEAGVREASIVASDAVALLHRLDRLKEREGKKWASMSMLGSIRL